MVKVEPLEKKNIFFELDHKVDTFEVKAIELGELQKIKIRHDDSGGGAAWFLSKIEIIHPKTNRGWADWQVTIGSFDTEKIWI